MQTKNGQSKNFTDIHPIAGRIINSDQDYLTALMKEMGREQPFFTSGMLESVSGLQPEETEDLLTLYLVVWGVYRQCTGCHQNAVTLQQYERVRKRNISMFNYLDKEDDSTLFGEVVRTDYQKLNYGQIMQYVSHCFQTQPALAGMKPGKFCAVLIDLKSFIECLEEIAGSFEQRA